MKLLILFISFFSVISSCALKADTIPDIELVVLVSSFDRTEINIKCDSFRFVLIEHNIEVSSGKFAINSALEFKNDESYRIKANKQFRIEIYNSCTNELLSAEYFSTANIKLPTRIIRELFLFEVCSKINFPILDFEPQSSVISDANESKLELTAKILNANKNIAIKLNFFFAEESLPAYLKLRNENVKQFLSSRIDYPYRVLIKNTKLTSDSELNEDKLRFEIIAYDFVPD